VAENVAFPMEWKQKPEKEIEKRVAEFAKNCGFGASGKPFPT
jgi:ABC-type sugar transport system ATPase subunit